MSSRSRIKAAALVAVALGCVALAGCSDIYYDRRETVALHAGDAMAANRVTQMIDPWSRASGNRNIAFNGEKMQTAAERYRTGRVIPPVNATTSSVAYHAGAAGGAVRRPTARRRRRRAAASPEQRATVRDMKRSTNATNRTGVVVFTMDFAFEQLVQATFKASAQIDLQVIATTVAEAGDAFDPKGATVVIIDLDAGREDEMQALERLMARDRRAGRRSWWSRSASTPTWRGACCRCGWPISW